MTQSRLAVVFMRKMFTLSRGQRVAEFQTVILTGLPQITPGNAICRAVVHRAMWRDGANLFRFVTRRGGPYTNHACERALRSPIMFREVTNCFRVEWGAQRSTQRLQVSSPPAACMV